MNRELAVDTSVAVPLLVATASSHAAVSAWARGRELHLSGHALVETYSMLTRLPAGIEWRRTMRFACSRATSPPRWSWIRPRQQPPPPLAQLGIAGGAVYDALVALAAVQHEMPLATRDSRALDTYRILGVEPEVVT